MSTVPSIGNPADIAVRVHRNVFTSHSTTGILTMPAKGFQCYTLEPARRTDKQKPRCTDPGIYRLTIRWSPKHGRYIPHVENVPDFTAIEQHIGNWPRDTEGCTCLGETRGTDWVGPSHGVFDRYFALLVDGRELKADGSTVLDCGLVEYSEEPCPK